MAKKKISKFKKKSKEVLGKIYKEKDERSKLPSGRTIFNPEAMEELGLTEFKPHIGENFIEILPLDYDEDSEYFREYPVHSGVGPNMDQYICLKRFKDGSKCFRCEVQRKMYKQSDGETTNEIKRLYPADRTIYLVWDRTKEFVKEDEPDFKLQVFNASKKMVHTQIQDIVRDKKKKTILDISDVEPEGEGRTVFFKVTIKESEDGKFPTFGSFDLSEREEPLPDEIMGLLEDVIDKALEKKNNVIDYVIHVPTYEELKESMSDDIPEEKESKVKPKGMKKLEKKFSKKKEIDLDDLEVELTEMTEKKIKKWVENREIEDVIDEDMDKEEMIEAILTHYAELQEED